MTNPSGSSATSRLEWLEVMRGLAAVWVLLHHATLASVHHFRLPEPPSPLVNGFLGVDFFFVLSGFIIAFSSHRLSASGRGLEDYARARLLRIYVPYLPVGVAMLVAYAALPGLSHGSRATSVLTSLTLLPASDPPALSVAWTLVHELIFYAVFAVYFVRPRLLPVVLVTWALLLAAVALVGVELDRFAEYFLSPLNLCFLLGVAVFGLTTRWRPPPAALGLSAALGLAGVGFEAGQASPNRVVVALGFGLLVLAAACAPSPRGAVFAAFGKLGAASYAIYLVHDPTLALSARVLSRVGLAPWLGWAGISVIALAAGLGYWFFYERFALEWARARLAGRRPAARPAPTPPNA